jgi:hypothetical protein
VRAFSDQYHCESPTAVSLLSFIELSDSSVEHSPFWEAYSRSASEQFLPFLEFKFISWYSETFTTWVQCKAYILFNNIFPSTYGCSRWFLILSLSFNISAFHLSTYIKGYYSQLFIYSPFNLSHQSWKVILLKWYLSSLRQFRFACVILCPENKVHEVVVIKYCYLNSLGEPKQKYT